MSRHIYIFRHGETEYGRQKIYLGHTECRLSQKGINDAGYLSQYFNENKIVISNIYSSDLLRCRETVKLVFPGRKITFSSDLREINMGAWDGLTFDEIKSRYPEDYKKRGENIEDFAPVNGESFRQCQMRAIKAFNFIINTTSGNAAICTHAGFIRALFCRLLNMDLKEIFNIKQEFGCINIVTIEDSKLYVEVVNSKCLHAGGK